MKKYIFPLTLVFLMASGILYPAQVAKFPEIQRPDFVSVGDGCIYVTEEAQISVYSLSDFRLLHKFGKKGEGPGEFLPHPGFPIKISILKEQLMVETMTKLLFFGKDGSYRKEIKKLSPFVFNYLSAGNNFVATYLKIEGKKKTAVIALYNEKQEKLKDLYAQKWVEQGAEPPAITINMGFDFPVYRVHRERIFIEESDKGFRIAVFDLNGAKTDLFTAKLPEVPMTDGYKEKIQNRFRNDPRIKIIAQRLGGMEQVFKLFTTEFPDIMPPIRDMEISGDRIYLQTYKTVDGKDEYIIMNLKGKILKKGYAPAFEGAPIMSMLTGSRSHAISEGKLYFFDENTETAVWSLNMEEIR